MQDLWLFWHSSIQDITSLEAVSGEVADERTLGIISSTSVIPSVTVLFKSVSPKEYYPSLEQEAREGSKKLSFYYWIWRLEGLQ